MVVVLFLLVLAVLVFVHEAGHFLAAKSFGIRVEEFAVGFPPRIWSVRKGETKYSLNLIPFGGYVRIFGENPDEAAGNPDERRSFAAAPKWKQVAVLLAGIFMNFVFAWLLISITFMIGMAAPQGEYAGVANPHLTIVAVLSDSPAEEAGLKAGDRILALGSASSSAEVGTPEEVEDIVAESSGPLSLEYLRGAATSSAFLTAKDGVVPGKKAIGISMDMIGTVRFGPFRSLVEGGKLTAEETVEVGGSIIHFFGDLFSGTKGALGEVAGPVGIAGQVGAAEHLGLSYLFDFIALISINLALLNLIPFPALDGGRILFVLLEAVFRKKIKPAVFNAVNLAGFAVIVLLMLLITYRDIAHLIK